MILLGKSILDGSKVIRRYMDSMFADSELTGIQARMIGHIGRSSKNGSVYQRDIEEAFKIRRSSITSVLQVLEKDGYIERISVEEDKRQKRIILTRKGMDHDEKISRLLDEMEQKLSQNLSEGEQLLFLELMEKIVSSLPED